VAIKWHVDFLEHRISTECCTENASTALWVAKNTKIVRWRRPVVVSYH